MSSPSVSLGEERQKDCGLWKGEEESGKSVWGGGSAACDASAERNPAENDAVSASDYGYVTTCRSLRRVAD